MPFKSKAQRAWMHIHEPEMAKRWDRHTPKGRKLPKHVSDSLDVGQRLALSALLGPVGEALAESDENLALESAGNIQRLLGFTPQVATVIHKWFGSLDFTAAKLLASIGEFEDGPVAVHSPDDYKNPNMVDEDDVHMMVGFGFYGLWSKVRFPSEDPYHGAPDDLLDFLKRNPKIIPKINSAPIGPQCIELAKQTILSQKKPGRVMVPLGGGWNWVDLGTSCDDAEAAEMQHCGTDSRGTLISLRDPQGNAHVTMSYDGNTVHQIKGKQNTVPVRKYWPYIVQFFKQTGAKLDDWWLEAAAKELPGGDDFDHAPELMQLLAPFVKKKAPVREAALKRNNSVAMVIVPGEPPGRNVCAFVRSLVQDRSRVIVVAQSGRLAPGNFERMMRASMPDCEKKLRIMDASGPSLADALNSAQRNHHYSPSQALQVYCDQQTARGFQQEVSDGSLKFDPTVINIVPSRIPSDAGEDIVRAVKGGDESAMHRVLDPHIFSSQEGLGDYKQALLHTEGVIREATRWQNFMANTKLQTIPWELDNYVEGIEQWEKELPDDMGLRGPIYCSIVLLSAAEFSKRTKRGNPQTAGWMVDCEIFMVEPDDPGYPLWFFHSEKRFADIEQARAQVEKLKTFVDSKTLLELERYPKSGKIAMSKFESLLREGIKRKFPGEKLYVHFSSRPKPPRVPNRSMNFMSSGGPPGIYAYPMDAAMTYASDRTDAYVLRPRVEVLDVMKYTREQLERDIQRLSGMVDLSRSLRLWSRYEREVVRTGPPFAKLWYLLSRIPRAGDEYPPGVQETAFGNPQLGRELLLKLGYSAIEDSIGIIYGTEPKQVLFLTDESFEVIDHVQNPETFRSHETQRELVERLVDEVLREFLEEGNIFDIEVPSLDGGRLNEFGTGSPGSGANGPVQVRASNSSSWASGQLALSDPRNHVPEDENEEESDRALDWGPGRVSGASF